MDSKQFPNMAAAVANFTAPRTVTMTVEELACHLGTAIAANMGMTAMESLSFVADHGQALLNAANMIADKQDAKRCAH